jgi:tRNA (guanine26-N2/guanine27-N2)-dimethyltransferase
MNLSILELNFIRDCCQERTVQFQTGSAFYRPQSRLVRDLGVLAAVEYKAQQGELRVLETMSGCGVRSLRYGLEAQADWLWVNDGNSELATLLETNLKLLPSHQYRISSQDASQVLAQCLVDRDRYDLVDIDGFGNPSHLLGMALGAVKVGGLVYLTATDGRSLTGHDPDLCLRRYGAYARSHPSCQEQGLRILIGRFLQEATARGFGLAPIFSFFTGQTFRILVQLLPQSTSIEQHYGFLGYCHGCGFYQTIAWRKLGRALCPCCDSLQGSAQPLTLTGPMWLGKLHDRRFLAAILDRAQSWDWQDCITLLRCMIAEAEMPPYSFGLGEIGRRGKMDPPKRDRLLQALQEKGYLASPLHWNAQAIKTNADLQTCMHIAKSF